MAKLYNLARVSTATIGTGTVTLGSAISGFLTFALAGVSDGETVAYGISDGAHSEVGSGVYTASGTTLTRSDTNSTNSNAAINLSGTAQVYILARAQDILNPANNLSDIANTVSALQNLSAAYGGTWQYFTSSGTFTTPANSNTSTVYEYVIQGGGGGGGACNNAAGCAGGGGAGGEARGTFTGVAASTGITVTVGIAGAGGLSGASNGAAGGTSSIGSPVSVTAVGGNGALTTGGAGNGNGASGGGTTGSPAWSRTGGAGDHGWMTSAATVIAGGDGASSGYGEGGIGGSSGLSIGAISAATGYGAGGGGGFSSPANGTAGSPGFVAIRRVTG